MGKQARPQISAQLLPVAGAAGSARNMITQACLQWNLAHLLGPASLVVTELVNNAVVHAGTMIDVYVIHGSRYLLILVYDGDSVIPVMTARSQVLARSSDPDVGRGLMIVNEVSTGWGYQQRDGGKVVWAALRLAAGARQRPSDSWGVRPAWSAGSRQPPA